MKIPSIFLSQRKYYERQNRELEKHFRANWENRTLIWQDQLGISSFESIIREPDGQGGEELVVNNIRKSIISLCAGNVGLLDFLMHRQDERFIENQVSMAHRIRNILRGGNPEKPGWGADPCHFQLVRNASSTDLVTAVKNGGKNTAIIIDGHGAKGFVNMTDNHGGRVTNNQLREVVGKEKVRLILKSTCIESEYEDLYDNFIVGNETIFGTDIADKTLTPPFFD